MEQRCPLGLYLFIHYPPSLHLLSYVLSEGRLLWYISFKGLLPGLLSSLALLSDIVAQMAHRGRRLDVAEVPADHSIFRAIILTTFVPIV
jgi:hypothetical protein